MDGKYTYKNTQLHRQTNTQLQIHVKLVLTSMTGSRRNQGEWTENTDTQPHKYTEHKYTNRGGSQMMSSFFWGGSGPPYPPRHQK